MSYLIHSYILHYELPSLFCHEKFVIYISCSGVIIQMHLNYIYIFIGMFVHHIKLSILICLCTLYTLIVVCTSSWVFFPISLQRMGYYSTVLLLHSNFYVCVCKCYIYDYCDMLVYFIPYAPLLYSIWGSLPFIFNVYDLLFHFNYPYWPSFTKVDYHLFVGISCHMHWNTYISSFFCCFLLISQHFTLNIQYSKTCNQHHLYIIFKQILIFLC